MRHALPGVLSLAAFKRPLVNFASKNPPFGDIVRDNMAENTNGAEAMPRLRNYINGTFQDAIKGQAMDDFNPATGAVHAVIPKSTSDDIEAAVAAAEAAFPAWSTTSVQYRASLLDKIADLIEQRAELIAQVESADAGKTIRMARQTDAPRSVANFRFFAGAIRHDETNAHMMHDAINYDFRCPIGICGLITPWNLPLYLLSWKVAPALACGNCVIAKPSEITPRTASLLAEIIDAVGVPKGVFNLVHGTGAEAGSALVAHPKIRCVSFTGGTATGKVVAAVAAPLFKKLSLELGGKNSTVIFGDYDVDKAVAAAVRAGFTNNGQVCLCGSRIFVQKPIYEAFLRKFVAAVSAMRVGPPLDESTDVGPVSSAAHREKIEYYVSLARDEGGIIECGGDRPVFGDEASSVSGSESNSGGGSGHALPSRYKDGYFIKPCVISGLRPDSRVSTEEIFGPVVTVHPFETEDEVVSYVNIVKYGLAGSIWTKDLTTAHRVCRRIDSGILWVNCWLHRDLRTPFGGVKDSGIGREGGKHSLEFYSEYKNVCVHIGAP